MKRTPKEFIVKVQKAVATSSPGGSILIYNQDRSIMWEQEETPAFTKMMGNSHKKFFWAELVGSQLHVMGERPARDPGW
jgi:hypothetical protein